ncbi:hypothetical protein [Streptomyces sp. CA2R106]|uniref:hypothetical protein n=1 Tax=Streptomyces sp. CA2R106 TaxID=3120153 RepID=UPI003009BC85
MNPDPGAAAEPYAVLAAAAARWDRIEPRLEPPLRARLAALLGVVRDREDTAGARDRAAADAAGLLRARLPEEFGPGGERLVATAVEAHPGAADFAALLTVEGFSAEDFGVLLTDGHRMVGPVLGPVRDRLLAQSAVDAAAVAARGGDPYRPELIRLPAAGGRLRLPRFQFTAGLRPLPPVLEVNALLAAGRDPWGAADWWLSANAWLGARPVDLLGTHRERQLADAAGFLREDD